jgi:hypothetical protein
MTILENAYEIAENGPKKFRLFEIDYQLGRLIERYKEKLSSVEWYKGIDSLEKAINANLNSDNQYIKKCIDSKTKLETYISEKNTVS